MAMLTMNQQPYQQRTLATPTPLSFQEQSHRRYRSIRQLCSSLTLMGSNNNIHSTNSTTNTSVVEGMAVVRAPVNVGAVAPEAMDGDTTMGTMDTEAETVDITTYPCHTWVDIRWSNTLKRVFQASRTR